MNRTPTVLVVEDDNLVRETLGCVLEDDGFNVDLVANGEAALQLIYERQPDIVISDIRMPIVDGYELFRRMQADRSLMEIPVIFISALASQNDVRQGMALGVADYLTKPFDPPQVCQAIRVRLRQKSRLNEMIKLQDKVLMRYLPHEMRTPLSGIIGYADLMLHTAEAGEGLSSEETKDMGNQIMLSGQRLLKLSDKLMLLSELQQEKEDKWLVKASIEWLSVAESHLKDVSHMYGRDDDLQIDLQTRSLDCPAHLVSTVISELVENGFKFSMPGQAVILTGREVPEGYLITVLDRGRGMTEEQLRQTGAFVQHNRAKYEQQGLGVGLEMVRKFCKRCQVELSLERPQEGGLKVELLFPQR